MHAATTLANAVSAESPAEQGVCDNDISQSLRYCKKPLLVDLHSAM